MKSWKTKMQRGPKPKTAKLQWSHDYEVVENHCGEWSV